MASKPYVVRSRDYLTAIASRFGVTPHDIWSDPANADLKKRRSNPEILAPGDVVYVPEVPRKWLAVQSGTSNNFSAKPPAVTLHVILHGHDGKPLKNASVTLTPPSEKPLKTDGSGLLTCSVNVGVQAIDVAVDGTSLRFRFQVAGLDPAHTPSGLASRLRHLGHGGDEEAHAFGRAWIADSGEELRAHALRRAVMSFQKAKGETPDGEIDEGLCDAVKGDHGC